jgi:hypothetical protein
VRRRLCGVVDPRHAWKLGALWARENREAGGRLTGDTGSRKAAASLSRALPPRSHASWSQAKSPAKVLNLHEHCHYLVHFELPWNPNRMEQCNGRIESYGQTQPPTIAFLYAEDYMKAKY